MEGRKFVLLLALTVLTIAVLTFTLYLLTRQEEEPREPLQTPAAMVVIPDHDAESSLARRTSPALEPIAGSSSARRSPSLRGLM